MAIREKIEVWVGEPVSEETFYQIDKNGGGSILFKEFANWAVSKEMDLDTIEEEEVSLDHQVTY